MLSNKKRITIKSFRRFLQNSNLKALNFLEEILESQQSKEPHTVLKALEALRINLEYTWNEIGSFLSFLDDHKIKASAVIRFTYGILNLRKKYSIALITQLLPVLRYPQVAYTLLQHADELAKLCKEEITDYQKTADFEDFILKITMKHPSISINIIHMLLQASRFLSKRNISPNRTFHLLLQPGGMRLIAMIMAILYHSEKNPNDLPGKKRDIINLINQFFQTKIDINTLKTKVKGNLFSPAFLEASHTLRLDCHECKVLGTYNINNPSFFGSSDRRSSVFDNTDSKKKNSAASIERPRKRKRGDEPTTHTHPTQVSSRPVPRQVSFFQTLKHPNHLQTPAHTTHGATTTSSIPTSYSLYPTILQPATVPVSPGPLPHYHRAIFFQPQPQPQLQSTLELLAAENNIKLIPSQQTPPSQHKLASTSATSASAPPTKRFRR